MTVMYVSDEGDAQKLGNLRPDTPDEMLLDWFVSKEPRPGDVFNLVSGRSLVFSKEVGFG